MKIEVSDFYFEATKHFYEFLEPDLDIVKSFFSIHSSKVCYDSICNSASGYDCLNKWGIYVFL